MHHGWRRRVAGEVITENGAVAEQGTGGGEKLEYG
jgi:hypothetical protein